MNNELKKNGFSLTEVLLAVGILAIGMLFIAGTFLVGINFATIATEQTIAAVASDEAFAKIKLYGVNLGNLFPNQQTPFAVSNPDEFAYPSTNAVTEKQYYWSALCRRVGSDPNRLVQVTVFVSRKVGAGTKYRNPADPFDISKALAYPVPVEVAVSWPGNNILNITEPGKESFVNDGYTIVDNATGQIYRVVKRRVPPDERVIELDRNWAGPSAPLAVWVVPPPFGGRHSCIAVYQKVMRF